MNPESPTLRRLGFSNPNAVRLALGLKLVSEPELKPDPEPKHYLTGEDRLDRIANVELCEDLMVCLALGGERAEKIALIVGCSPSAVKKRLRKHCVSHPPGNPDKIKRR